jgi:hypothetical protein
VIHLIAVEQQVLADDLALRPGAPAARVIVEEGVEVLAFVVVGIGIAGEVGKALRERRRPGQP